MTTYVKIYTIKKDNIEYIAEVTYTPDTEVSQVKVNKNEGGIKYFMGEVAVKNNDILSSLTRNIHSASASASSTSASSTSAFASTPVPASAPASAPVPASAPAVVSIAQQLPTVPVPPTVKSIINPAHIQTAKNRGYPENGMFYRMYTSSGKNGNMWRKTLNNSYKNYKQPSMSKPTNSKKVSNIKQNTHEIQNTMSVLKTA